MLTQKNKEIRKSITYTVCTTSTSNAKQLILCCYSSVWRGRKCAHQEPSDPHSILLMQWFLLHHHNNPTKEGFDVFLLHLRGWVQMQKAAREISACWQVDITDYWHNCEQAPSCKTFGNNEYQNHGQNLYKYVYLPNICYILQWSHLLYKSG